MDDFVFFALQLYCRTVVLELKASFHLVRPVKRSSQNIVKHFRLNVLGGLVYWKKEQLGENA
ncbi:MAG TPA: hypothetical protein DIW34_06620 [Oribacterium sp.]|nr:hypothetical protein [Oribacterium sp.]